MDCGEKETVRRRYRCVPIGEFRGAHIFYHPSSQEFSRMVKKESSVTAMQLAAVVGAGLLAPIVRVLLPDTAMSSAVSILITVLVCALPVSLFFWFVVLRQEITLESVELVEHEQSALMEKTASDRRRIAVIFLIYFFLLIGSGVFILTKATTQLVVGFGLLAGMLPFMVFIAWVSFHRVKLARRAHRS